MYQGWNPGLHHLRTLYFASVGIATFFLCPQAVSAGDLAVTNQAAFTGDFGLEIRLAAICTDNVVVPTGTVSGEVEACQSISADLVDVEAPGALFRAGTTIALGNDFTVLDGVPFIGELDPLLPTPFRYVEDWSPFEETSYHLVFHANFDGVTLPPATTLEIFNAYSENGDLQFQIVLLDGKLQLHSREADGSIVEVPWPTAPPVQPGWNKVESDWAAGGGDGHFTIALNDGTPDGLQNLVNGDAVVDFVRFGANGGTADGDLGFLWLDEFLSSRPTEPDPEYIFSDTFELGNECLWARHRSFQTDGDPNSPRLFRIEDEACGDIDFLGQKDSEGSPTSLDAIRIRKGDGGIPQEILFSIDETGQIASGLFDGIDATYDWSTPGMLTVGLVLEDGTETEIEIELPADQAAAAHGPIQNYPTAGGEIPQLDVQIGGACSGDLPGIAVVTAEISEQSPTFLDTPRILPVDLTDNQGQASIPVLPPAPPDITGPELCRGFVDVASIACIPFVALAPTAHLSCLLAFPYTTACMQIIVGVASACVPFFWTPIEGGVSGADVFKQSVCPQIPRIIDPFLDRPTDIVKYEVQVTYRDPTDGISRTFRDSQLAPLNAPPSFDLSVGTGCECAPPFWTCGNFRQWCVDENGVNPPADGGEGTCQWQRPASIDCLYVGESGIPGYVCSVPLADTSACYPTTPSVCPSFPGISLSSESCHSGPGAFDCDSF